uniref:Rubredoxin-like domain-containing protein n=1 Tax=Grammatophora oceanica TaxID=210454 RepID=A0A7S1VTP9_9STRA|mmetsp:Transcript_587/g.806  ORF Transcript_587/g.806 Transcript_587/m.806 type:complete len:156 (+) Transcript_587:158-625(+)|eukprot:CAMPEP_0194026848 /NCGR_PEP_ID=MMETSP0009_2-20130614/1104_1 /TAXON_ID=210454 /ORGANISM="Grammatophora oceanica, Strain CCMP 410" /LENGTH=155 /DNA_ID=CAMNT_0038665719 /DNA_START=158 /DNA_END=625 /DNA_ORIENTATION=+
MKSFLSLLLVALLAMMMMLSPSANAFTTVAPSAAFKTANRMSSSTTSLNMVFGNKKSAAAKAAQAEKEDKYWEGDWVCKDCGYIYNRAECAGMFFEEQGPGFRCPQCSGPRRRYAKKVGDVVGTTLDGGDAPILIFSFGGVIATIIFGIWAVNNL